MRAASLHDLMIAVIDTIVPAYNRLGTYFVMSILDDPAMLAFSFK
jgi:hypothetical protein